MIGQRLGRAAGRAVLIGLATGWGGPLSAQAPAGRACEVIADVTAAPKLVCPFESVTIGIHVQARCSPDLGVDQIRSVRLSYPIPAGMLSVDPRWQPPATGRPIREWSLDRLPPEGITLTHRVRPIRPGEYALGSTLQLQAEDVAGRPVTGTLRLADDAAVTVADRCSRVAGSSIHLPAVMHGHCLAAEPPGDIVLTIDRSPSVAVDGVLTAVAPARAFIDMLDLRRQRVAIIAFDQTAEVVAPLGSDRARLWAALDGLRPTVGTAIDRAIEASTAHLATAGRRDRGRLLVLFTDGVQTGMRGEPDIRRAAADAGAAGIAILPVALGPAPNRRILDAIATRPHTPVAEPSGAGLRLSYQALVEDVGCGGKQ